MLVENWREEIEQSFQALAVSATRGDRPDPESRIGTIQEALAKGLTLHRSGAKVIGSAHRSTAAWTLPSMAVDVVIPLNAYEYRAHYKAGGSRHLVTAFVELLSAKEFEIGTSTQTYVEVPSDAGVLRLMPAFRLDDGDLLMPVSDGEQWVRSRPDDFWRYVYNVHQRTVGSFTLTTRIVKHWNGMRPFAIRGFHLETMLARHFERYERRYTFESMITGFLNELPRYLGQACVDPTTGNRIDEYLGVGIDVSLRERAIDEAASAAAIARRAFGLGDLDPRHSMREWSRLFDSLHHGKQNDS